MAPEGRHGSFLVSLGEAGEDVGVLSRNINDNRTQSGRFLSLLRVYFPALTTRSCRYGISCLRIRSIGINDPCRRPEHIHHVTLVKR